MKSLIPQAGASRLWRSCRAKLLKTIPKTSFGIALLLSLMLIPGLSAAVGTGTVPVAPAEKPTGGFAIDGNLEANVSTLNVGDWVPENPDNGGTGGNVLTAAGAAVVSSTTYRLTDPYNSSSDNNFGGGLKFNDDPNDWTWVAGGVNDKTDVNNALIHFTHDGSGNLWVILAGDRLSGNGAAYIDFELLQNTLIVTNSPSNIFISEGPDEGRTDGDLLLTVSMENGGTVANFFVNRWEDTGGGNFDYVELTTLPLGSAYAAANSASVPVSFTAFGGTTYPANVFAEGAINLTALLAAFDSCQSLGIKTIFIKTKQSPAPQASIEDFLDPVQVSLTLGVADAGKDQFKCNEGASTSFTVTGVATPSPGDSVTRVGWSVVSGTATIPDATTNALSTPVQVSTASATLRFTVVTTKGCTVSDNVVLTVIGPTVTTSQQNVSCNGAANGTATANISGGATPITISWNTTPPQTTATATGLSAGDFIVTVTDASNCVKTATVTITEPLDLTVSTTQVNVLCNGAATGSATAIPSGGTGAGTYSFSWNTTPPQLTATATGLKAGPYTVTVTDGNGCTETANVTITEPSDLTVSTTQVNVLCNGAATGSATAIPSGGTGAGTYSFSWNTTPPQLTATATGLKAGPYTVTVTDGNGCTETANVTITEPSDLTVSTTQVNVLCNGAATGSATAIPSGGTGAGTYSFSWNTTPPQLTATATGLQAGPYTVTVTDGNGCTETANVTITEASDLSVSTTQVNVLCNGATTGSATAIPSGGTGAGTYSFSWNTTPPQLTATATGLKAGPYTVTVTDGNGCTETANVTITEPSDLTVSTTQVNVLCNGAATGSATAIPSGGTGAGTYSFSWNTTPPQLTATATGLKAGPYTVTVTDGNGCTETANVTITEPSDLTVSTTQVNVLCNGAATGSATAIPSGGTGAGTYSFSWNTTPPQLTATATGLKAGPYTVTVTDGNGCTETANVTITEASDLTVSTTQVNVLCNGAATGSATAIPSGGTGAGTYSFSWNTTPPQLTATATGLKAGPYTVTVTDGNGCTETANVTITEPSDLSVSTTQVNVLCNGAATGSATAIPSGGTGAGTYSFSWNTTPPQLTATATGLKAGPYTVTVTDGNGCTETANVTITEPSDLTVSTTQVNVLCNGAATGSATAIPSGGTGAGTYSFSWNTTPPQLTATATGLKAGPYTVTVTDGNGCTETANVTITEPSDLTVSTTQVNVLCNGAATGSATAIPSGGTGAGTYSFSWNTTPPQLTATATGLKAGPYTVTVTDGNGCTETANVTITEPSDLSVSTTQVNVLCNGAATGSASAIPSGGTGAGTYSFSWNTTPPQLTATATGLKAGPYTVTVTDGNGCTETANVTITEPSDLTVSTTQVNVLCNGAATGSATAIPSGGTGAGTYSFSWNTTPPQLTATATGLKAGPYTVTVTDGNGCTETANVTITEPSDLTVSTTQVNVLCNGAATGSATAIPSGGTGAGTYSFSWNTTPPQLTATATGLKAGPYTVTVTDGNGCTETANVTITEPSDLTVSTTQVNILCNGAATGSATAIPSGGTGAGTYSFSWNTTPPQLTATATGLKAGPYTVTVTDGNGCTETANVTITEPKLLELTLEVTQPTCSLNDGKIVPKPAGGTAGYTYTVNTKAATAPFSGLTPGTYDIVVTDANGCTATATTTLENPLCNGHILETGTTCAQYYPVVTKPDLTEICYFTKAGKITTINNVAPGVFFYYSLITAPDTSFTIDLTQSVTGPAGGRPFDPQKDQVIVYNTSCTRVANVKVTSSQGQAKVEVKGAVSGETYIVSIKYSCASVVGQKANLGDAWTYKFLTKVDGKVQDGTAGSLLLKQCK